MSSAAAAKDALASLRWALSGFETPQPIALDLDAVTGVSDEFAEAFFAVLAREWPESYFGPHPIVVVGVAPAMAQALRDRLACCGLAVPVAEARLGS